MNNDQKIQQLERQVAELMQWKEEKTRQQIKYPLDDASIKILNRNFLLFDGYLNFSSVSGDTFPNILVKHDGVDDLISISRELKVYTADATTDTMTSLNHGFVENQAILVYTTDDLPAPLTDITPYYIKNAATNTFQLSTTAGGAVIDITTAGTGIQYAVSY